MSAEEQTKHETDSVVLDRVIAVLADCQRRRESGEAVPEEALVAAYPELMPVLGEELRKLRLIAGARELAANDSHSAGSQTGCDEESAGNGESETDVHTRRHSDTGSGHLEVRCPSCHEPMEVAVDTQLTDLTCSACGSHFSLVDQSQATRMAPSLTKMGRFELIERIGVGAFGSVWKARDKQLDRTVAVKIPRQGGMSPEEQEKFFREARAAAQLKHPSIVSVHEVGRDGDSIYIVSDFVRGVTLGDWLTGQQLTSREAAELCARIADALHHAHEHGVVHRDLKPANIMVDGDGQPHLMDFGLARRDVGEVTVTMDGQVLGTPAYMSPEQALGASHRADRRSDVYSLGVILFQLLTGELPFRGNARMLMHQVMHDEPPSPRNFNPSLAKDLETITLKCLEKEPTRRYQTAEVLAEELRRYLAGVPILARAVGRIERAWRWCHRHWQVATLAISVAVLLVAVAALSTAGYARAKKQQIAAQHAALREAELRGVAEENFRQAQHTVDEYLTLVSQTKLLDVPGLQPLRKELLELALQYYKKFAKTHADDPEVTLGLAEAYFRVGTIQRIVGADAEATNALQEAARIWEDCRADGRFSPELSANVATAYVNLAILQNEKGDSATALKLYCKATPLWQELVDQNPRDVDFRLSLARTLDQVALMLGAKEQTEASHLQDQAYRHFQVIAGDARDGANSRRHLAQHFVDIAVLKTQYGDLPAAVASLGQARSILEDCLKDSPQNMQCQRQLADVCARLGRLHVDAGNMHVAVTCFAQARKIQGILVGENPTLPDLEDDYLRILMELVAAQLQDHNLSAANATYLEVCRLTDALTQRTPDDENAWLAKSTVLEDFAGRLRDNGYYRESAAEFHELWKLICERYGERHATAAIVLGNLALVQAAARDEAGYRATCQTLLENFAETENSQVANVVAWSCTLRPDGAEDWKTVLKLAEFARADRPDDRTYQYTLGATQFRAGLFETAARTIKGASGAGNVDEISNELLLAMIYYRWGRIGEGQRCLIEARKLLQRKSSSQYSGAESENAATSINKIEQSLLLSEAEQQFNEVSNRP